MGRLEGNRRERVWKILGFKNDQVTVERELGEKNGQVSFPYYESSKQQTDFALRALKK